MSIKADRDRLIEMAQNWLALAKEADAEDANMPP
jgi:hypothetical protein